MLLWFKSVALQGDDNSTGDNNNQIHFEGYQVSNQCMALVRDDCLIPTKDVPELGYIKESSNEQYVPDVFYKVKTWISCVCWAGIRMCMVCVGGWLVLCRGLPTNTKFFFCFAWFLDCLLLIMVVVSLLLAILTRIIIVLGL